MMPYKLLKENTLVYIFMRMIGEKEGTSKEKRTLAKNIIQTNTPAY